MTQKRLVPTVLTYKHILFATFFLLLSIKFRPSAYFYFVFYPKHSISHKLQKKKSFLQKVYKQVSYQNVFCSFSFLAGEYTIMDSAEEARLLKLFDEVDTDEEYRNSSEDSIQQNVSEAEDSEPEDPFGGDDDRDPDFLPSHDESSDSAFSHIDKGEDSSRPVSPNNNYDAGIDSDEDWVDVVDDIPDFNFDSSSSGVKLHFEHAPSPTEIFKALWTDDIMDLLVTCTNTYGKKMEKSKRPHPKYSRFSTFSETNKEEMYKFIGLCLLQAQMKFPVLRKMFSLDPLYYHPVFSYVMSGRRYEVLLRAFNCTNEHENNDRLNKVSQLLKMLIDNYQKAYSPGEALSLDESLLLHRGRLSFRQYIKGKKAKYGIKFYELCSPNGYNHNIEIYKGKQLDTHNNGTKLEALVFRLIAPFLDKGHHLIMDNYYNSVALSNKLLQRKTHTTGTIRSNRKGNPKQIISEKLKKGEHKWMRKGKIYISKWKDKREVLCITTKFHPELVVVKNSFGQEKMKPKEIAEYNLNMSGVDRCDQLTSYYSCPRKSVRWYKKVMFHLLDVTTINSFILFREITKSNKKLLQFRENIIKDLLGIFPEMKDGRKLVKRGAANCTNSRRMTDMPTPSLPPEIKHILEKIPLPETYNRKSYFLRCRQCSKNGKRGQTSWRCQGCEMKPPLCVGKCFELYHLD